jgi:hypothetical protein
LLDDHGSGGRSRDIFHFLSGNIANVAPVVGFIKKSTSQCTENARDTAGRAFFSFSLAPRIPRAYKETVSSLSSGGSHESTGLRSASKLSTPLLRCESRTNRLKPNSLVKRRSKRKKRALIEGSLCFCRLHSNLDAVSPRFEVDPSYSSYALSGALLLRRLMRGVLVFPAMLLRVVAPVVML